MYKLVPEVCKAFIEVLKSLYVIFPTKEDFEFIAPIFYKKWNMPNCCGAGDVRNSHIKTPIDSSSLLFNSNHFRSVVLMGISDAYARYLWVNFGDFGKYS